MRQAAPTAPALLLAPLLALAACAAPAPPPAACSAPWQLSAAGPSGPVQLLDHGLGGALAARLLEQGRTPSGTVSVVLELTNCTGSPLQVEARTQFFDSRQVPTEPPSGWHRVHLPSYALGSYQESSTDAERVASFRVEIRAAR